MRILVSGAGTAGLSAGIDLARSGHEVEIVERANHLRVNGSPIDVRGAAIETARSMGILDAVREHRITMTEQTTFIDRSGTAVARLAGQEINDSPDDIELPREDLVTILRRNLPEQVDLRFEESIATLADDGERVAVTFASGREAAYDIVVGADGVHSTVRRLVFGPEEEFTEHLGVYVAIGHLPDQAKSGTARVTEILNLPGRFAGVARYRDRALGIFEFRSEPIDYDYHDLNAQKRILAAAFAGIEDWKVPELVETAQNDPDLYFDAIAQILMPSWHRGRVVLIGDAAHCATPMAGRGVSLALLGAWTLTEELERHGDDLAAAFNAYEQRQRPHAAAAQEFARGGADLMVPATWEAIEARNTRLRAARPLLAESCSLTGSSPSHEGVVTHRTPSEMIEEVRRMIAGDGPEFSTLFATDGVLRYPFAPPGTPAELRGREAIREFYRAGESSKGLLDMTDVQVVVHRTDDPELVMAEFSHHGWSHATDEPYTFRALAVARVRDGRFVSYEDYIDSIAMARMLGRTQQLADALTA
jgi:2-polyprenyl-6-methoxyphenol hydroxylase-like FAD-dependent oxidoreductase/ketosteroid isomerase-like protein